MNRHVAVIHLKSEAIMCEICSHICSDKRSYKHHTLLKHSDIKDAYDRVYPEPIQRKEFKINPMNLFHKNMRHYCDLCSKKFVKPCQLRRHVSAVHLKVKAFKCEFCDKSFAESRTLAFHKTREHMAETIGAGEELKFKQKNHECEVCLMKFVCKAKLERHVNEYHLNLKPFKCTHCEESFKGKREVLKHIQKVHDDDGKENLKPTEDQKIDPGLDLEEDNDMKPDLYPMDAEELKEEAASLNITAADESLTV